MQDAMLAGDGSATTESSLEVLLSGIGNEASLYGVIEALQMNRQNQEPTGITKTSNRGASFFIFFIAFHS